MQKNGCVTLIIVYFAVGILFSIVAGVVHILMSITNPDKKDKDSFFNCGRSCAHYAPKGGAQFGRD